MSQPSNELQGAFWSMLSGVERGGAGSGAGGRKGSGVLGDDSGVGGAEAAVCVHLRSFLMSKEEQVEALECAARLAHTARDAGEGSGTILVSSDTHTAGVLVSCSAAQQLCMRTYRPQTMRPICASVAVLSAISGV